jgi:hypothetical protein
MPGHDKIARFTFKDAVGRGGIGLLNKITMSIGLAVSVVQVFIYSD